MDRVRLARIAQGPAADVLGTSARNGRVALIYPYNARGDRSMQGVGAIVPNRWGAKPALPGCLNEVWMLGPKRGTDARPSVPPRLGT